MTFFDYQPPRTVKVWVALEQCTCAAASKTDSDVVEESKTVTTIEEQGHEGWSDASSSSYDGISLNAFSE